MWIRKYVTGSFHDQFEVIYGLVQMIENDDITKFLMFSELEQI
jgi:hypothetical protein